MGIVLLLEFLNSFRSFGLRFVQYNYITNEFGVSDTQAGALLGVKGFVGETYFFSHAYYIMCSDVCN